MNLSDLRIRQARPREKRYMLADGDGLYLEIMTSGNKHWRYRYWENKREVKLSLGEYPAVGLKDAREKRDELNKGRSQGVDPREVLYPAPVATFESVALEWLDKHIRPVRVQKHTEIILSRMSRFLFPSLGRYQINDVTPQMLLKSLRDIEARGTINTAHRVKAIASAVFRYGIATGVCDRDAAADLKGALQPTGGVKHFPVLTDPQEIGGLLRAAEGYMGSYIVKMALLLSIHLFQRPKEIRTMEWNDVDFDKAEWKIPAEKTKKRRMEHIVPLSTQAISLLKEIQVLTGHYGKYVFPAHNVSDGSRPMSENGVRGAIRRLGYTGEELCAHGLRGTASTALNESGLWSPDAIEAQLSHVTGNAVRSSYNHAKYMPERRKMMQWWSDWLDELKENQDKK